jgi:hypothetical protein
MVIVIVVVVIMVIVIFTERTCIQASYCWADEGDKHHHGGTMLLSIWKYMYMTLTCAIEAQLNFQYNTTAVGCTPHMLLLDHGSPTGFQNSAKARQLLLEPLYIHAQGLRGKRNENDESTHYSSGTALPHFSRNCECMASIMRLVKWDQSYTSEFVRQIQVNKIWEEIEGKRGILISEDKIQFIYTQSVMWSW